jgi:hypothetical protein
VRKFDSCRGHSSIPPEWRRLADPRLAVQNERSQNAHRALDEAAWALAGDPSRGPGDPGRRLGLNRIDRAEQWPWMYTAAFRKPEHP